MQRSLDDFFRRLFLTPRTKEDAPLPELPALHHCTTSGTRLALATIHAEASLEPARQPVGIPEVAVTRPSVPYRPPENELDRPKHPSTFFARERRYSALRQDSCHEQRLAPIDVADTGDKGLVEQDRSDFQTRLFLQDRFEMLPTERWREGIYAENTDALEVLHPFRWYYLHPRELAHVGKIDRHSVRKSEPVPDKLVVRIVPGLVMRVRPILHEQVPGHLEMDDDGMVRHAPLLEIDHDMLADAPHVQNFRSDDGRLKHGEGWPYRLRPFRPERSDDSSDDFALQLADNGLYFGKFGHRVLSKTRGRCMLFGVS